MAEFKVLFRGRDAAWHFSGETSTTEQEQYLVIRDSHKREVVRAPWANILFVSKS